MAPEQLINLAKEAMTHAYAPYSGFKVGCNIENASYSPTNCAERTAFFKAVYDGHREFSAIAVCGGMDGILTGFTTPCGVCRQVMKEFCGDDFLIYVVGPEDAYETYTLAQLLPSGFSL